jgi:hypothetical protein
MFGTAGRARKRWKLQRKFELFVGVDWGSERHRVCIVNPTGDILDERRVEHSGQSLAELGTWLHSKTTASPHNVAVAIELPRGPVVETLMEQGFAVFSINPSNWIASVIATLPLALKTIGVMHSCWPTRCVLICLASTPCAWTSLPRFDSANDHGWTMTCD